MTIQITNLTFSYPGSGENVFEDVSCQIDTAWRTGVIGRNGRGKTTLLRLLNGDFEGEYSGRISRLSQIDYFPCEIRNTEVALIEALTEASGAEEWRICRELSLLEMTGALYRPFSALSGGEQTKALLATMFLREGRFLLIDEPTNHLDGEAKRTIGEYLRRKSGFLLVSHDRELLDTCTDHILSLGRGCIEVQNGNFSSWKENAERREACEREKEEKLRSEIKRLKEAAKRTADWSEKAEARKYGTRDSGLRADRGYVGHKAAKMMKTSKVIEARQRKALEEKSTLLKNVEENSPLKLRPLEFYTDRLLEAKSLQAYYGDVPACPEISFSLYRGDRVALNGKNGSGKSSVLKAILGETSCRGVLEIPPQLKISYVAQDNGCLAGSFEEYARAYDIDESLFKAVLHKFGFEKRDFSAELSSLSAGQKKKTTLARSLCESAHLYIWDEPLNFIDIPSRIQIEELILAFRPTLLFVEHDGAFRRRVATRIIEL